MEMRAAHGLLTTTKLSLTLALALIASACACACVREGAPVVAPVDVSVDAVAAGAAAPAPLSSPARGGRCTARLRAGEIVTNPSCTLDERISRGSGTLLYPCVGDGPVEAVFGEHHFVGKLSDDTLVLTLTTELDCEDGCHWETRQGLRGEFHRDANGKRSKLTWGYSERPVTGPGGNAASTAGCFGTCTATADIDIGNATGENPL